jgi:Prion-inhibition and propagation
MDPVGVTGLMIGIVTLYSTCRDCYIFFTNVQNAENQSELHLREFDIQQSILKAWGFYWEIQRHDTVLAKAPDNSSPKNTKLLRFLSRNVFKAEGVFQTLRSLADTLSDHDKLIKRYGLDLKAIEGDPLRDSSMRQLAITGGSADDVQPIAMEIRTRLSVLTKCRWVLKDKDCFKKLIMDLKAYNDTLYRLCPEGALDAMKIFLTLDCLAQQESPIGLMATSTLAEQLAQDEESLSMRPGFELLASAASFKARVVGSRIEGYDIENEHPVNLSDLTSVIRLGKRLAIFEGQVVYIEDRSYRDGSMEKLREKGKTTFSLNQRESRAYLGKPTPDGSVGDSTPAPEPDNVQKSRIMDFYSTLHSSSMGANILCLEPIGIVDHTKGKHQHQCSILYKLPNALGVPSRFRPAEDLKLRAPVTLDILFRRRKKYLEKAALGARFELARKLVHAICLLHASGWLHKNIRAESVLFFPELVESDDRTKDQDSPIDISNPIIMGYLFSRTDDMKSDPTNNLDDNDQTAMKVISRSCPPPPPPGFQIYQKGPQIQTDYYQHPAKAALPARLYRHAYDVYSLGVLLLEIGLWSPIEAFRRKKGYHNKSSSTTSSSLDSEASDNPRGTSTVPKDHYEKRRQLRRQLVPELRFLCGDRYADIVLECLMVDTMDDEVSKASQRELFARIAVNLENCQA